MRGLAGLAFRFLVAVDVESFSRRSAAEQVRAQDKLEYAMSQAAAAAGLDRWSWYRQPRGDGELAVLPPGTDGLSLVADYPRKLARGLADLNRIATAESRLRVRMAIHHGAIANGRFGPVGTAPVVVSRLVDAEMLGEQLRQRIDVGVALIVSATVHDEVVQSRFHGLSPEAFCLVSTQVKGVSYVGYLYQGNFAQDSMQSTPLYGRTVNSAAP
jgi:hypothetical protein